MRKLLTALATTSLIGSIFLGVPAAVSAAVANDWAIGPVDGEDNIIHVDASRNLEGKTQTYAAPAGSVLEMYLSLETSPDDDLDDEVSLTLTNAEFTDTTSVNYGGAENPIDGTDCVIGWDDAEIGGANGGSLVAVVDCDTDDTGNDNATTVAFEITLAEAGTSAVLEVSGDGISGKVYFFGTESDDEIYVGNGILGSVATPVDGNCTNPDFSTNAMAQGSIEEAMFAAFAAVDGDDDTIILCEGYYTYGDDFEEYIGTDLYDGEINLVAETDRQSTLDGDATHQLISASDVDLVIEGVVFYDGYTSMEGGAIELVDGDLTVINCEFDQNISGDDGGAIHVWDGTLDVSDSTFSNNYANGEKGGAIYLKFSDLENVDSFIIDSTFTDNVAGYMGGAVVVKNEDGDDNDAPVYVYVDGTSFEGNAASSRGGALRSGHQVLLSVDDSSFVDNRTDYGDGGAISAKDDATIGFSLFRGNEAGDDGGAIYFDEFGTIHDSRFVGNMADDEGGAVYGETQTRVNDTVFLRNRATYWAGALSLRGNAWIDGATFRANKSRRGGAIDSWGDRLYLIESKFINNRATRDGGAIIRDGETRFGDVGPDTIFRGNQARLGDSVAMYRWKVSDGGPGLSVARTWARVWTAAGTTVWLVRR